MQGLRISQSPNTHQNEFIQKKKAKEPLYKMISRDSFTKKNHSRASKKHKRQGKIRQRGATTPVPPSREREAARQIRKRLHGLSVTRKMTGNSSSRQQTKYERTKPEQTRAYWEENVISLNQILSGNGEPAKMSTKMLQGESKAGSVLLQSI